MTSSGENGLNITTNVSQNETGPGVRRSKRPSVWLAVPVAIFYGNLRNLVIRSKPVIRSRSVKRSQIGVMSE